MWRLYQPDSETRYLESIGWSTALCGASTAQKVELYLESIGARRFVAPLLLEGRILPRE
jgi:hypothetical protein